MDINMTDMLWEYPFTGEWDWDKVWYIHSILALDSRCYHLILLSTEITGVWNAGYWTQGNKEAGQMLYHWA